MKRILLLIILILLTLGVIFYEKNLKGIWPAIEGPSQNIAEIINNSEVPGANLTKFPLSLPNNFKISIFKEGLNSPRVLTTDPSGNLAVSLPPKGEVLLLTDKSSAGKSDTPIILAQDLNNPHGILFTNQKLYVAEEDALTSFDYDSKSLRTSNKKKLVSLPKGGNHTTKSLILSPNKDKILISVGSSCNVCSDGQFRAQILSVNFDGTDLKTYASGLRNSVFLAINSIDNSLWATDMGRDFLGDDAPPDEINIIKAGGDYGWPICYGKNIHDTDFDHSEYFRDPCADKIPSHIDLQAHSAPLGLAFIPKDSDWPSQYQGNLLVAFHGSWNRTTPTGYKIVRIILDQNQNFVKIEDFITGWLSSGQALGRPVGILINSKGQVYISDDKAGVIYLLKYVH